LNLIFLSVQVDFKSNQTFAAIQVVAVTGEQPNQTVDFASEITLIVE